MNQKDPQREAKKHQIQMEIVMKDGDCKKMERKKMELEIEIRQMKKKQQQLALDIVTKEREMAKRHSEHLIMLAELRKLKNSLSKI